MPTKEQMSDEINNALGTELDFSRMKKEDLEHLRMLLEDGTVIEALIKGYIKEYGTSKLEEEIDNWTPGQYAIRLLV